MVSSNPCSSLRSASVARLLPLLRHLRIGATFLGSGMYHHRLQWMVHNPTAGKLIRFPFTGTCKLHIETL